MTYQLEMFLLTVNATDPSRDTCAAIANGSSQRKSMLFIWLQVMIEGAGGVGAKETP
jgi:hypothetical protein